MKELSDILYGNTSKGKKCKSRVWKISDTKPIATVLKPQEESNNIESTGKEYDLKDKNIADNVQIAKVITQKINIYVNK